MSSHRFFICIVITFIFLLAGCFYFGLYSSKDCTTTTDKTIFNYNSAFKEMKRFKGDFNRNVFTELINSLNILVHSKKEHLRKIAELYIGEVFDKETKINKKLLEI